MIETIKSLIKLSEIDESIHNLFEDKEDLPNTNQELDQQIKNLTLALENKKTELAQAEAIKKDNSEFIQTKVQWIAEREERINDLKTQKEYQAAQKEITMAKKEIKDKETELNELGPKINTLTNELMALNEKSEPKIAEYTGEININNEKLANLDSEIEKLKAERVQIVENIPTKKALDHYNHILKKVVPALSSVVNGVCMECGTKVPPQAVNMLKVAETMQYCSRCKRILYIEEMLVDNKEE